MFAHVHSYIMHADKSFVRSLGFPSLWQIFYRITWDWFILNEILAKDLMTRPWGRYVGKCLRVKVYLRSQVILLSCIHYYPMEGVTTTSMEKYTVVVLSKTKRHTWNHVITGLNDSVDAALNSISAEAFTSQHMMSHEYKYPVAMQVERGILDGRREPNTVRRTIGHDAPIQGIT